MRLLGMYQSKGRHPVTREKRQKEELTLDGNPDKSGSALTRDTGDAVDDRHMN